MLFRSDPAMSGNTAAVILSVDRKTRKRYVLDVENMRDPSPQKIKTLIETWVEKYRPNEIRIETNAHQKAYALDNNLREFLAMYGCQMKPHYTSNNKWDTSFGVASMATLFGSTRDGRFQDNNLIELPSNEGSEGLKTLVQELITWKPDTRNPTDCVMALWFAILRVRELMQQSSYMTRYQQNRWTTKAQTYGRGTVNLDEAFAEQWQATYG